MIYFNKKNTEPFSWLLIRFYEAAMTTT